MKQTVKESAAEMCEAWGMEDNHYGYFVGVYYGNGCWESDHRVFLPDSKIGKVTYWMPLPKKGGEI